MSNMADPNQLVLVDTNCLVRVYFSSIRPIMNCVISGHELKTLQGLASELKGLARRPEWSWLGEAAIQCEIDKSIVLLSRAQKRAIEEDAEGIKAFGDAKLHEHCTKHKTRSIKALSLDDAKVLAASLELDAILSTDEWPLRLVSGFYDYDDGGPVKLFSSVDLIHLMEKEGLLSREDRMKTYADWLRWGEQLLKESPNIYLQLFGEIAPTAQN